MKNKTEPTNIVLASDQTYYIGLWVTLVSLLSNTMMRHLCLENKHMCVNSHIRDLEGLCYKLCQ